MGTSLGRSFGWGKLGALCSLKAIALAGFLTPATVTVVLPTTPALAQFGIVIPGFGGVRFHGRRYGRRYARHHRYSRYSRYIHRRHGGEEPGEVSAPPSGNPPPTGSTPPVAPAPSGTGKKMQGTSDN